MSEKREMLLFMSSICRKPFSLHFSTAMFAQKQGDILISPVDGAATLTCENIYNMKNDNKKWMRVVQHVFVSKIRVIIKATISEFYLKGIDALKRNEHE
jgi:hypothetical protein